PNGNTWWVFNILEWGDDFTYVAGRHSMKTGVDIQRMRDNYSNPAFLRGTYTFSNFNNFLAGTASNLQASSPIGATPYVGLRQSIFGVYAQDDFNVNSHLTLNFGLRWEAATDPNDVKGQMAILPSPSATNTVISDRYFSIAKKNFEPRFGLAWQL